MASYHISVELIWYAVRPQTHRYRAPEPTGPQEGEEALTAEVARLRYEGASWLDIAEGLDTVRQNAWRKYRNYRRNALTGQVVAGGEI